MVCRQRIKPTASLNSASWKSRVFSKLTRHWRQRFNHEWVRRRALAPGILEISPASSWRCFMRGIYPSLTTLRVFPRPLQAASAHKCSSRFPGRATTTPSKVPATACGQARWLRRRRSPAGRHGRRPAGLPGVRFFSRSVGFAPTHSRASGALPCGWWPPNNRDSGEGFRLPASADRGTGFAGPTSAGGRLMRTCSPPRGAGSPLLSPGRVFDTPRDRGTADRPPSGGMREGLTTRTSKVASKPD